MPPSRPALLAASSAVPRSRATRPYAVYGGRGGGKAPAQGHTAGGGQSPDAHSPLAPHPGPQAPALLCLPQPCPLQEGQQGALPSGPAHLSPAPWQVFSREIPGGGYLSRQQQQSQPRRPGQGCDRLRRQGLERTDLASPASHILPDFSGVGTLATDFPGTRSSPPPTAGSHVVNTNCSAVHTRQALCCKMAVEYDKFIESGRKYVVAAPCLLQAQGQCRAHPLVRAHCRFLHTPPGGSATWMTTTT